MNGDSYAYSTFIFILKMFSCSKKLLSTKNKLYLKHKIQGYYRVLKWHCTLIATKYNCTKLIFCFAFFKVKNDILFL